MTTSLHYADYMAHVTDSLGSPDKVDVEFVIPVYNEEDCIAGCVKTLSGYLRGLRDEFGTTLHESHAADFSWRIMVADNASTDSTWDVICDLVQSDPSHVRTIRLDRKGRGFALKTAWLSSRARVLAYMDADLSTGLEHIDDLVKPLLLDQAQLAIGSRLLKQSQTTRSLKREFISRTYNALLRTYSGALFSDAQCGFKAIRADAFNAMYEELEDNEWFFDTELLLLAQFRGYRLNQIPVRWIEDTQSSVHITDTVMKDLKGMWRMHKSIGRGMQGILQTRARVMENRREPIFRGSLVPINLLVTAA
ncbi:dolichyl-phosphate beta-glucosyltransferase [Alloscardovia criceti]|uniref:dolichyl-phosphate beta-glucosyltransferase n=1 Tax=Alloscardovia criceti TaxID=356828 RepID=UPI00037ABCB1|nr:dolichyl-phosphate beta-glucosyltransferase [Alloscardovia criceti]